MINRRFWVINFKENNKLEQVSMELSAMLPPKDKMSGLLILEEVLTNVEKYAYSKENDFPLLLIFFIGEDPLKLIFMDYGIPFNPTTHIPSEITKNQIGGHGLRIIKEYAKDMQYQRTKDNANILEVTL